MLRCIRQALCFVKVYPQQVAHNAAHLLDSLHDDLTTNCADLKSGVAAILATKPSKQQLHDFIITVIAFTVLPIILLIILILPIIASVDSTLDTIHDI